VPRDFWIARRAKFLSRHVRRAKSAPGRRTGFFLTLPACFLSVPVAFAVLEKTRTALLSNTLTDFRVPDKRAARFSCRLLRVCRSLRNKAYVCDANYAMLLRKMGRMADCGQRGIGCCRGLNVRTFRKSILAGWRRPVGWIAAYALVLQLVLAAFAGAQFSAQAADQNWSFFEICYGKGAPEGETPSGAPSKQASKSFGCVVCANATAAAAPEAPEILPIGFSISTIDWIARDDRVVRAEVSFSQRQRAPPFEA
jgi:hypothetical protein